MPRKLALTDLERSGLTRTDAQKMEIEAYSREASKELGLSLQAAGYRIPYFTPKGKPTGFFRYRLLEDPRGSFARLTGKRPPKYLQPPKSAPAIYYPPFIDWQEALAGDDPLIITEGEKKAAATTKAGLPTLGLGGVWSFQSKRKGQALLPDLEAIPWEGRRATIVFDSDAAANEQVRAAALRLSKLLTDRGADVYLGYVPAPPGAKAGLDDYLLDRSPEELLAWLDTLAPMASSQALHEMNDLVTYVFDPGLVVVNSTGQQITPAAFKDHAFATYTHQETHYKADGGSVMKTLRTASEWLRWPARAEVQRLVYEPGAPKHVDGGLNLWTGYSVEPKAGDVSPWLKLLDFLFASDDAAKDWFQQWAAYPLQHPGAKLKTAVLMWGRVRGTGKSLTAVTLGDLYGDNYTAITDADFNGAFNPWAHKRQFILYDEVSPSGSRERANLLKNLITREEVTVNIKHLPQFKIRDCINYYLASNHADALYIEPGERRYFVHEVRAAAPLPSKFYDDYAEWRMSTEGRAALLHYLLTYSLKGFNPHAPAPRTADLQDMIGATRTDLEVFLEDLVAYSGEILDRFGGGDLISLTEIAAAFEPQSGGKMPTNALIARKLKQMGVEPVAERMKVGPQRTSIYALRNYKQWLKVEERLIMRAFNDVRLKARVR